MKIPSSGNAPLIRTNFSDEESWRDTAAAVTTPPEPFMFTMQIVDDRANDGATAEMLMAALPAGHPHACMVLADGAAMVQPGHPLLVVDLVEEPGRRFRAVASEIASIDNNLSIANMGFAEFAAAVHDDGVFRGFRAEPGIERPRMPS